MGIFGAFLLISSAHFITFQHQMCCGSLCEAQAKCSIVLLEFISHLILIATICLIRMGRFCLTNMIAFVILLPSIYMVLYPIMVLKVSLVVSWFWCHRPKYILPSTLGNAGSMFVLDCWTVYIVHLLGEYNMHVKNQPKQVCVVCFWDRMANIF